jgi:hypothetical protein
LKAVATEENLQSRIIICFSTFTKNIREESGYPLINRENNKISLTENGKSSVL